MVHTCIVKSCKSEWSPGTEIKFHAFPIDTHRRKGWLACILIKSQFYNGAKVCSLHFKQSDYDKAGKKLKKIAKPFFKQNTEEAVDNDETASVSLPYSENHLAQEASNSDSDESVSSLSSLSHNVNERLTGETTDSDDSISSVLSSPHPLNVSVHNEMYADFGSSRVKLVNPGISSGVCTISKPFQCQIHNQHPESLSDKTGERNKMSILKQLLETPPSERDTIQNGKTVAPKQSALKKSNKSVQVNIKSDREEFLRKRNRILMQKVKRQTKYINDMKSLLYKVKQYTSHSEIENIINGNFADISKEFKTLKRQPKVIRYSEEVKSFALNLQFYSPKAYEFLKQYVNMPHAVTLRRSKKKTVVI